MNSLPGSIRVLTIVDAPLRFPTPLSHMDACFQNSTSFDKQALDMSVIVECDGHGVLLANSNFKGLGKA